MEYILAVLLQATVMLIGNHFITKLTIKMSMQLSQNIAIALIKELTKEAKNGNM